jgi:hypothetical protein
MKTLYFHSITRLEERKNLKILHSTLSVSQSLVKPFVDVDDSNTLEATF